jgi:hypothetical protein
MRNTERYIPEGYELAWNDETLAIQVYYREVPHCSAICFVGRAVKPTWHYRFKNAEQRQAEVTKTFKRVHDRFEAKNAAKLSKAVATANHGVKVGDVFRSSWGYDQTNIDYYEVIAVTGKTATICQIGCMSEETLSMQGESVPLMGAFIGKPFKKLIQKRSTESGAYFNLNSYATAFKMEPIAMIGNKPVFEASHWTAYA